MSNSPPVYHKSAKTTGGKDNWGTPQELYELLDKEFGFTVDLAALPENAKHTRYFSPQDNALSLPWNNEIGFLNPPYSELARGGWLRKARDSAETGNATTVALLPARVGTNWFWRNCRGSHIRLLPGRLTFEELDRTPAPNTAGFPSCIVIWGRSNTYPPGVYFWDYREGSYHG